MRKIRVILISLAVLGAIGASTATAQYWGYAQERAVKRQARQFVRELRAQGIDATFKFYEDGSWQITGCVSDGLCKD